MGWPPLLHEDAHGPGGWPRIIRRRRIGQPCAYCRVPFERAGRRRATRDHAFPKHKGYRLSDLGGLNGVLACEGCNAAKKGHDIVEWWWRLWKGADVRAPIVLGVIRTIWLAGHLPEGNGKPYSAVREELTGTA